MKDVSSRGRVPGANEIHTVFVPEDGGALPCLHGSYAWLSSDTSSAAQQLRLEAARWTCAVAQLESYFVRGDMKPVPVLDMIQGTRLLPSVEIRGSESDVEAELVELTMPRVEFHAVEELIQVLQDTGGEVSILILADPTTVGGNFSTGGPVTMEEALCFQSTWHLSLRRAAKLAELQHPEALEGTLHVPPDGALLSPKVQVFREGPEMGFRFLPEPLSVAVVVAVSSAGELQTASGLELAAQRSNKVVITELGRGRVHQQRVAETLTAQLLTMFRGAFREVHFVGSEAFLAACQSAQPAPEPPERGDASPVLEEPMAAAEESHDAGQVVHLDLSPARRRSLPSLGLPRQPWPERLWDSAPALLPPAPGATDGGSPAPGPVPAHPELFAAAHLAAEIYGSGGSAVEVAGDSANDTIIMDSGSSLLAAAALAQQDLEVEMIASQSGQESPQSATGQVAHLDLSPSRRHSLPSPGSPQAPRSERFGDSAPALLATELAPGATDGGQPAPEPTQLVASPVEEPMAAADENGQVARLDLSPTHSRRSLPPLGSPRAPPVERFGHSAPALLAVELAPGATDGGSPALEPVPAHPELSAAAQHASGIYGSGGSRSSLSTGSFGLAAEAEAAQSGQVSHLDLSPHSRHSLPSLGSPRAPRSERFGDSAPALLAADPAAGRTDRGSPDPASAHPDLSAAHRAAEIYGSGTSRSTAVEVAGDSVSNTIIMDSGSFGLAAAALVQEDLELEMMASQLGQDSPQSASATAPAHVLGPEVGSGRLDEPCNTFFEELESYQRKAFDLTNPHEVDQELRSTREKVQHLHEQRAALAAQRRLLVERQADLARAKDRLLQELQHNSSKGGCDIS